MEGIVKALSIMQPWAWLIVNGHKDVENRSWEAGYRGPLLIHAGKKLDREGMEYIREEHPEIALPAEFERGGVVGMAKLVGVVRWAPGSSTRIQVSLYPGGPWRDADWSSPWFFGEYGFVFTEAHALPFRPVRGRLGFFDVETS